MLLAPVPLINPLLIILKMSVNNLSQVRGGKKQMSLNKSVTTIIIITETMCSFAQMGLKVGEFAGWL